MPDTQDDIYFLLKEKEENEKTADMGKPLPATDQPPYIEDGVECVEEVLRHINLNIRL